MKGAQPAQEAFKFHLHGFSPVKLTVRHIPSDSLNSIYTDLVICEVEYQYPIVQKFKFHLHGFSQR